MPLIERKCPKCGETIERLEKFSDAENEMNCPNDGAPMEQQFSRTSFTLKGRGWYADGYSRAAK